MSIDASREAFEAWYLYAWGADADLHGLSALDQWLSWQASRKQALEEVAALFPHESAEYFGSTIQEEIEALK